MSFESRAPESRTTRVRVYRRSPWPVRVVSLAFVVVGAVTLIADRQHSPVAMIVLGLAAVLLVLGSERSGVRVSSEGVANVPLMGRRQSYRWAEINGFAVGKVPGGYGGPVVSMSLANRTVYLTPTEYRFGGKRAVEQICKELNTELQQARRGHH